MSEQHPGPIPPYVDLIAHLLGRVAHLMGRAFTVPGTNVRFGLDGLLGLLPLAETWPRGSSRPVWS